MNRGGACSLRCFSNTRIGWSSAKLRMDWKPFRKVGSSSPDLILLDIGLPELNGIQAARRICEIAPKSKILFLSENLCQEVVREAFRNGAWGYVVKSDAANDLLVAVEAVIGDKRFVNNRFSGCTSDRPSDA
jgi:DNA-binding NarL/FixJ family response regulator